MNIQIKSASVCDAADGPLYDGGYDEDGERRYLRPPHAWFIQVAAPDGRRYYQTKSVPFRPIQAQQNVVLFYRAKRELERMDEMDERHRARLELMKETMPANVDPGLFDRLMAEANGGERIERSERASWDDEVLLWAGQALRACKRVSDKAQARRSATRSRVEDELAVRGAWISQYGSVPHGWFWSGEVGHSLLIDAEALAALEVLKVQAAELLAAGEIVLDNDTAYPRDGGWQQSAYSEYGSAAAEEEARLMEQRHRQEGY